MFIECKLRDDNKKVPLKHAETTPVRPTFTLWRERFKLCVTLKIDLICWESFFPADKAFILDKFIFSSTRCFFSTGEAFSYVAWYIRLPPPPHIFSLKRLPLLIRHEADFNFNFCKLWKQAISGAFPKKGFPCPRKCSKHPKIKRFHCLET